MQEVKPDSPTRQHTAKAVSFIAKDYLPSLEQFAKYEMKPYIKFRKQMVPVNQNKDNCHNYLDGLQPIIFRALDRNNNVLEQRYQSIFNALKRAKNNLHKYKESLQNLQDAIDKSSSIQKTQNDVDKFKSYSDLLSNELQSLKQKVTLKKDKKIIFFIKIEQQFKKRKHLKKIIKIKHGALNMKNASNLALLREINKHKNSAKLKSKDQHIDIQLQGPVTQKISDDKLRVIQQLDKIKQENKLMRHQIYTRSNMYIQKKDLFSNCMQVYRKQLEKTQKVVNSSQGLQGSLLFEMKKAQLFLTDSELTQQKRLPKSSLQGREVRALIHDTLKGMLDDREGKKKRYLNELKLDWEKFKEFQPIQIMGVMCLKPKVFEDVEQILEGKARKLKEEIELFHQQQ